MTQTYSLLKNPRECYDILLLKALDNSYIQNLVINYKLIYFFAFQWFLLNIGCSEIKVITQWFGNNLYGLYLAFFHLLD